MGRSGKYFGIFVLVEIGAVEAVESPFVNFDSKYSIINGPPIFGFFETFLYV